MAISTNETSVNNTPIKNNTTNIDLDRTPNNNCSAQSLNTTSTIKNEQDIGINNINGYPEVNENNNNNINDHKSLELANNSHELQQNKNILVDNLNIIEKNKQQVNDLEDVSNLYNKMLIDNNNLNKESIQINNNNTITNNEHGSILN